MGEIRDFIQLYVQDSGMLEEVISELALKLVENIQEPISPGHGWITGDFHNSIQSDFKKTGKTTAIVEAYSKIEYAPWVDDGHTLRNGEWWEGYHFFDKGLDKTVAMYQ